jgi:hypothetical protein
MSFQQRLPDSGHREAKVALAPHSSLYQRTRSPERNVGEVMQVLLSEKSVEVHITPEVVIAAAKNGGKHMIQLLLKLTETLDFAANSEKVEAWMRRRFYGKEGCADLDPSWTGGAPV